MANILQDLLKVPAMFIESGVVFMDGAARLLQDSIETVSGRNGNNSNNPPVKGPPNMTVALSDLANQIVRVGQITPRNAEDIWRGARDVLRTARRTFSYRDPSDPRVLAMPLEFAASAGVLMADALMKLAVVYTAAGSQRFPSLMFDALELFSDTSVFMTLQYKDLIERYKERLERDPKDFETRLELGRMYVKCGLFDKAAVELLQTVHAPSTRARAWHELVIAYYRAGQFVEACNAGIESMKANPKNERSRNLMWLASKSLGAYPDNVPQEYRMEVLAGYETPSVTFEDIAPKLGLDKTIAGRGTAIFDYNNDGFLDIAICGQHGGVNLYRNNGDGTFTDVSVGSCLDECYDGFAINAGDYNNDGFVDLYITRLGFYHGEGVLFRNNGDGTFTDVTKEAGLQTWGPSFSAHWVDYDCDGNLDLFVSYNVAELFDGHFPNRLFHNNGDGTFTDVTKKAGLYTSFTTIGSSWGDYNNDGLPDLFISSGLGRPLLFRNNGDGTFTDVSVKAGMNDLLFGFVCTFCDYDNDGWLDIAQFIWSDHEDFVYTLRNGKGPDDGYPMRIYHNNRDGTFTAKDREIGLDGCWGTMTANFGDFNNDGYLDILIGNGSPRMERLEPPVLLEFDGARYHNVTFAAGLPFFGKGHGANFADLFGDGRLLMIMADGGAYPGELLPTAIYQPKILPGNFLNVRLVGTKSNRDAIGARLTLRAGGRQQVREVSGGTGFGCLPCEQHFGLSKLTRIDELEIRWPSGLRQQLENLPINDTIRIIEGRSDWEVVYNP